MSDCLSEQKYKELLIKAEEKTRANRKYADYTTWRKEFENEAYKCYLHTGCKTKEDLLKIAGLAYSWMPTMLDLFLKEVKDWNNLIDNINQFNSGDLCIRKELVEELSKLINHSVVGASKTLHIINPDLAPLVDSRVARGWNLFFKEEIKCYKIKRLPFSWSWNKCIEGDHLKKVNSYIQYWDYLIKWKETMNHQVSLRDIEIIFYLLGDPTN